MKKKILLTSLITLFILISWFAWVVYDYNYGKSGAKYEAEHCNVFAHTDIHFMALFRFVDCPIKVVQKSDTRLEKYRTVAELATIDKVSYFLGCQKEGDCSPRVMAEYAGGIINTQLRNSELIHDLNYTISPDKKKIAFLHDSAGDNALYLYDIEKQVGIDIVSEKSLKSNETISCEIGSSGMDRYSCGRWIDDTKYVYGIYRKSSENDKKFTLVREETYNLK